MLIHSLLSLQVVLAANDMPSINDITYEELVQVISTVRSYRSFSAYQSVLEMLRLCLRY